MVATASYTPDYANGRYLAIPLPLGVPTYASNAARPDSDVASGSDGSTPPAIPGTAGTARYGTVPVQLYSSVIHVECCALAMSHCTEVVHLVYLYIKKIE